MNNDCKNNDLGNVDLISSKIVSAFDHIHMLICALKNIEHYHYYYSFYSSQTPFPSGVKIGPS